MSDYDRLPIWKMGQLGIPNTLARSALFSVKRNTQYLDSVEVRTPSGSGIRATGPQLRQSDLDVYLYCVGLYQNHPLDEEIEINIADTLKKIGRKTSGKAKYDAVRDSLKRLNETCIEIEHLTYSASLIAELDLSGDHRPIIRLGEQTLKLFGINDYTIMDAAVRQRLSSSPLAQWLHTYYSTHQRPFAHTLKYLHEMAGSGNSNMRSFRQALSAASGLLAEATGWEVNLTDKLWVTRPNSYNAKVAHMNPQSPKKNKSEAKESKVPRVKRSHFVVNGRPLED